MVRKKRTAVFISGSGSNMLALADAARAPDFPAEIALVISNRPEAKGLLHAKARGLPTAAVDHRIHAGRADFEGVVQRLLQLHKIELICLAGFMRLLTPGFVEFWAGRMINIHPALLPAYKGLNTHARALADSASEHGCTVHYVTAGMDEGPILAQAKISVMPGESEASLAARVLAQEHLLYPKALALLARAQDSGDWLGQIKQIP